MLRDEKKEDDDWGISLCGRNVIDNKHKYQSTERELYNIWGKNLKWNKWENELVTKQSVEKNSRIAIISWSTMVMW